MINVGPALASLALVSACATSAGPPEHRGSHESDAAANTWIDHGGCRARELDYTECRTHGSLCQLEPAPEIRDGHCFDNADHCDDLTPPRPRPCLCSCSPEYKRRQAAVEAEHERRRGAQRDPACRDVLVEDGDKKVVRQCPPPPPDPR
jgi:hypothetical protein